MYIYIHIHVYIYIYIYIYIYLTVLNLVARRRQLHSVTTEDLEQLVTERRDILLYLVQVVLADAFGVRRSLALHDPTLDQVVDHCLQ